MSGILPNCGHCGRFTVPVDSYTNWGHAGMDEPDDPVLLCGECHRGEYERHLADLLTRGIPPADKRPTWQPSLAWVRAKGVARGMFRHGLVDRPVMHTRVRYETSGTYQVWFCRCGRPEKHPAHDGKEAVRLKVAGCKYEPAVGRRFGTFHVQEWCACGWTTGRHPGGGSWSKVDYLSSGALMREHIEATTERRVRWEGLDMRVEHLVDGRWVAEPQAVPA